MILYQEIVAPAFPVIPRPPSNQSLQLTAGRTDASSYIMKAFPFQSTLGPASGS
jgi:hypothetical protein